MLLREIFGRRLCGQLCFVSVKCTALLHVYYCRGEVEVCCLVGAEHGPGCVTEYDDMGVVVSQRNCCGRDVPVGMMITVVNGVVS